MCMFRWASWRAAHPLTMPEIVIYNRKAYREGQILRLRDEGKTSKTYQNLLESGDTGGELLADDASNGNHGKTAVVDLLGADSLQVVGSGRLEAQGIELEVAGRVVILEAGNGPLRGAGGVPALDDVEALDGKGEADDVGRPGVEEALGLLVLEDGKGLGDLGAEEEIELLTEQDAEEGEHGNTAVLELALLELLEVLGVGGRETNGVEITQRTGHTSLVLRLEGGSRKDDRVDDVDNTVVRDDVRSHHLGTINKDAAAVDLDGHLGAVDRLDLLAVERDDSRGEDLAGHDVVRQDGRELGDVLKESIDSAGGELGEGLVGGGEDGERTRALESRN